MTRRWMIAATGLFLVTAATVGCVSKEEYDRVAAAARRANQELENCQSAAQQVRLDNQKLRSELALRDEALTAKDKDIAKLTEINTELDKALKTTLAEYKAALDSRKPPAFGPVLPPPVDTALKALAQQNPDLMDYLPRYGMLKLKSDLTFDKGSAVVKGKAQAPLQKLAGIINTAEAKAFHVYVAGHTDDIPLMNRLTIQRHGSNWGLSCHRALSVVKALFESGVEQKRMAAVGFSKYHPVAPNKAGRKGNPLNRRVEIWIVPPDRLLTASAPPASGK